MSLIQKFGSKSHLTGSGQGKNGYVMKRNPINSNGDGTVPLRSALINGAVTDNMLVKYSSDVVDADHTGLIKGKDNGKTFDYICDVISGVDVNSYNDAEFFGKYSDFKEVQ